MKCPYCGEEMAVGYMQCRDSLIWDTKKRMVAALPSPRSESITLCSDGGVFSGSTVLAHNCQKCKKIILDYAK